MLKNLITILGSIVNIIEGEDLYDHLMSIRIFTVSINKYEIHTSSKNYEESGNDVGLHLLTIST